MALGSSPSQVLDFLFDEDNGVLSKELDVDGKASVQTLSFVSWPLLLVSGQVRSSITTGDVLISFHCRSVLLVSHSM